MIRWSRKLCWPERVWTPGTTSPRGLAQENRRVERQEADVLWQLCLFGGMARGTIEHHNQAMVGIRLTKTLQERFEAAAVKTRKVNTETLARCGIDRSVEVGPLVGAMHHIRRAKPSGTVALLMPADQSEACLIEGQNLQGLVLGMLLALSGEVLGELF